MIKESELLLPNFLNVFEQKLTRLKKQIKGELNKPKKERSKADLKEMLRVAKGLRKVIRAVKKQNIKSCPHCGGEI